MKQNFKHADAPSDRRGQGSGGCIRGRQETFEAHTRQLSFAINNFKCTLVLFCVLPSFCYVVLHNMEHKKKDEEGLGSNGKKHHTNDGQVTKITQELLNKCNKMYYNICLN